MTLPIAWNLLNDAYHLAIEAIEKVPLIGPVLKNNPEISAGGLGMVAGYGITRGAQKIGNKTIEYIANKEFVQKKFPNAEEKLKKTFKTAQKVVQYGLPIAFGIAMTKMGPEIADFLVNQHPVYSSGIGGLYAGGFAGIVHDKKKEKKLDELLSLKNMKKTKKDYNTNDNK